jgi:tripartite-type tricarboxylate transporter receptor subunit TctC
LGSDGIVAEGAGCANDALIAAAKAEPDKLSYGTYGTGTSAHLAGELFKHMAGVNLTTVPYKGSAPAITDLTAAQPSVRRRRQPSKQFVE